jgi:preprotein translocase subunit SecA
MFETMLDTTNTEAIKILFRLELASEEEIQELEESSLQAQKNKEMRLEQDKPNLSIGSHKTETSQKDTQPQPVKIEETRFGRNDIIKITNGKDTKELKFKKAKSLIESGEWKIL